MEKKITSLRDALALLKTIPGQVIEANVAVDPAAELSGVHRYVGAGGAVKRPTTVAGPAMIFHNVKGHPDTSVVIGVMASRERVAKLFGCKKEELGHLVRKCAEHLIMPELDDQSRGLCTGRLTRILTCSSDEYARGRRSLYHPGHVLRHASGYGAFGCDHPPGWLLKVKAVTHRKHPIMQTCIGPSEGHVNMAGIPTEASILNLIDKALPGKAMNVYSHRSDGGKCMAILQCKKTVHTDEGRQRQAVLLAFSAFPELKHVILVDEDVDIFDTNDDLLAMNTRFQGDRDIITIPGVRCHPLDPSSHPDYTDSIRDIGISTKTIFMELDSEKYLHG